MSYIAIVDYGAGNLMSVHNTLDYLGYENKIAASADVIENAAGVILPGVGAFPDAMAALTDSGLTEAVLKAAKEKPFLGICLGMQMAAVEFARHVIGWEDANSAEFDKQTPHNIIDLMLDQKDVEDMGGTQRLGQYPCRLVEGTLARELYGCEEVGERHRHRYEFNNDFREIFANNGMVFSGLSPDGKLVEIIELPEHPFFIASQFHPEFVSRPNRPQSIFKGFIGAAKTYSEAKK